MADTNEEVKGMNILVKTEADCATMGTLLGITLVGVALERMEDDVNDLPDDFNTIKEIFQELCAEFTEVAHSTAHKYTNPELL